jgi:hypothetical protein
MLKLVYRERYMKLFMILLLSLSAQFLVFSSDTDKEAKKIREQRAKNYIYIIKSGDRDMKNSILEKIDAEFDTLGYTENDVKLLEVLIYLSQEGTTRKNYRYMSLINDFPEVRSKSAEILGRVGGDIARAALADMLKKETNVDVMISAINSLAKVGDNSNGDAYYALMISYSNMSNPTADYLISFMDALKILVQYNSKFYNDALILLTKIQGSEYSASVKNKAEEIINFLASENR